MTRLNSGARNSWYEWEVDQDSSLLIGKGCENLSILNWTLSCMMGACEVAIRTTCIRLHSKIVLVVNEPGSLCQTSRYHSQELENCWMLHFPRIVWMQAFPFAYSFWKALLFVCLFFYFFPKRPLLSMNIKGCLACDQISKWNWN